MELFGPAGFWGNMDDYAQRFYALLLLMFDD
jgi:hypothetical protein